MAVSRFSTSRASNRYRKSLETRQMLPSKRRSIQFYGIFAVTFHSFEEFLNTTSWCLWRIPWTRAQMPTTLAALNFPAIVVFYFVRVIIFTHRRRRRRCPRTRHPHPSLCDRVLVCAFHLICFDAVLLLIVVVVWIVRQQLHHL